jgi:hypothetical protein
MTPILFPPKAMTELMSSAVMPLASASGSWNGAPHPVPPTVLREMKIAVP